jgi:hypothetical protein
LGDLLTADISIRLPVMKFVMNGRTISLGRSMSSCVAANVFILRDMFSKSAAISLTLMSLTRRLLKLTKEEEAPKECGFATAKG